MQFAIVFIKNISFSQLHLPVLLIHRTLNIRHITYRQLNYYFFMHLIYLNGAYFETAIVSLNALNSIKT